MAATAWSGHLTFGLVSFPVQLSAAARRRALDFDLLHKKDNSRVRYVTYCAAENRPLERSEIVKGFAYEKGRYVILEEADFERAAPRSAKVMEIQQFVAAGEVDPVYLDASYYLVPREGGEKPYALLFAALRDSALWGIAQVAMHNREHTVIIRPGARGLLLHTMYYREEVRASEEYAADTSALKDRELTLARTLVDSLAGGFEPGLYHDAYRERLEKIIEGKQKGKKVVAMPSPKTAPVVDIMDALERSLAAGRKPAASTRKAAAKSAPRKARRA